MSSEYNLIPHTSIRGVDLFEVSGMSLTMKLVKTYFASISNPTP